jgi:adenine-specific DNA-methyltransferase
MAKTPRTKTVEALKHEDATRKNIPTAEYQSVLQEAEQNPVRMAYERLNRELDPQLVCQFVTDPSRLVLGVPPRARLHRSDQP